MADPAVQMLEMRQATRRKVNKAGRIVIDDTSQSDCLVRNLSDRGALISVSHTKYLPDEVRLTIPDLDFDRKVRIVWRRAHSIGVTF